MILSMIFLILAVPVGYLIAWMARDELVDGRVWFIWLIIASLTIGGMFWLKGVFYVTFSLVFIGIVGLVALVKSRDKNWTRKRI